MNETPVPIDFDLNSENEDVALSEFMNVAMNVLPDEDRENFVKFASILPAASLQEIMGGWNPEAIWAIINHGTGIGWFLVVTGVMRFVLKIGGPRDWEVPTRLMLSTNMIFSLCLGVLAGALRAGSLDPAGVFEFLNKLTSL